MLTTFRRAIKALTGSLPRTTFSYTYLDDPTAYYVAEGYVVFNYVSRYNPAAYYVADGYVVANYVSTIP